MEGKGRKPIIGRNNRGSFSFRSRTRVEYPAIGTTINIGETFTSAFSRNSPGFRRGSNRDCASRRRNLLTHTTQH